MIFTIGYQSLTDPAQLIRILQDNGVTHLVDVRSKPYSRKRQFNRKALSGAFLDSGIDYMWFGSVLGGFKPIGEDAIKNLAKFQKDKSVCLMCMEADYKKCHRYSEIVRRLEKYNMPAVHL